AELVEVVDVEGAEVDLQGVKDVVDGDAEGHALGAVDVEVEPGGMGAQAMAQAGEAVSVVAVDDDLVADALELAEAEVAAVFDEVCDPAGGAEAVDGWAAEDGYVGAAHLFFAAFLQLLGDSVGGQVGAVAFLEFTQKDVHRAEVGGVGFQDQGL